MILIKNKSFECCEKPNKVESDGRDTDMPSSGYEDTNELYCQVNLCIYKSPEEWASLQRLE